MFPPLSVAVASKALENILGFTPVVIYKQLQTIVSLWIRLSAEKMGDAYRLA